MLYRIIVNALLFLFPVLLFTQDMPEYAISKIPFELLKNAEEVVRLDYGEFEVNSDEEGTGSFKKVVTLLSEDSEADHLFFPYSNQVKVNKISIRLYDARGNLIRKVKRSDLTDHSAIDDYAIYEDARYKYYRANHYNYPYTIEYSWEQTISGTAFASFPNWYIQSSYNCSVESSLFKVSLPSGMNLHYEVLNTDDQVRVEEDDKNTVYTWEFSNIPALTREVSMPPAAEVFPTVLTAPDRFKIDKFEGGMSSWEEFSSFMEKLFEGRDELPEEFVAEIKTMTSQATTEKEKIEILYRFLQENMRYVSVQLDLGGWQPFDAEYVYRNKYGDCKALTNFMAAMLKVVDVDSRPALIGNGNMAYHVSESFTTSIFNHVILYVPAVDYWLECTSTDYPPNYIGSGNANRMALLIQKTGGHLVKTPELTAQENIREGKTSIEFDATGSAQIHVKIVATGSEHELYRYIENGLSESETREWLENKTSIPSVSFKSFKIISAKDKPESTFEYEAESRRYGSKAGKRIFLPLNVINKFDKIPPPKEKRKFPVVVKEGFVEIDTIVIQLPVGYAVESIPDEAVSVENDFGSYQLTVKQEDSKLIVFRKFELRRTKSSPESYTTFRNFFKQVAKADSHKVVLVKKA